LDNFWNIIQVKIETISQSDTKSAILLSAIGILITMIFTNISYILSFIDCDLILRLILLAMLVELMLIAFYCIKSISPRFQKSEISSYFFFKDIVSDFKDAKSLDTELNKYLNNDKTASLQYSQLIFNYAAIIDMKFKYLKNAFTLLNYFFLTVGSMLIYLIIK
jgi:hypothetical protein